MNIIIENFEFIRPQWLWALLAILVGYILKLRYGKDHNVWQQIIPNHLYQKMIVQKGLGKSSAFIHATMLGLALAVIAIAGPSWEKLPQVVYQTQAGKVILMDMSMSMRATDLSPNRLTRARFKAIDLVNEVKEGETGLVAYAGDAFVVSPLTDDANTLKTLIPVLAPEIMPTKGSAALAGLRQAAMLLENAGYQKGQIYWLTDGIRYDEIQEVRRFINESIFSVSALLIGTEVGAPIALEDGQLLKDYSGKIVVPSINSRYMNQAMAGTGGLYQLFANDNSDIQAIKRKVEFDQQQASKEVENTSGDTLKDMGPYLALLLLPFALYVFRKGVLSVAIVVTITLSLTMQSPSVYAWQQQNETTTPPSIVPVNEDAKQESLLDRVFKNADQRGKVAFDNQDFQRAQLLFDNAEWQGASAYKKGDFEQAANIYGELLNRKQGNMQENAYNKGNALAKQGKLEEAIEAYSQALAIDPAHPKAIANKQLVEQLLDQQQQQEQNESSSNESSDDQQNNQQQKEANDQSSQSEQNEEQKQSSQDNAEQNNSDENSSNENSSNENKPEQNSPNDESAEQNNQAKNNDALKQGAQEQNQSEQANEQQPASEQKNGSEQVPNNGDEQTDAEAQAQKQAISNEVNLDDLTPEQKEELQRMQMILNKIPDDPAYLLKRKMQLEAYRRKNNPPPPEQENW